MGDCAPSIDAKTLASFDDRASSFNDDLESIDQTAYDAGRDGMPEAKHRARAFIEEALALPNQDQQTCLLKKTEALGDSRRELNFNLPQLDLVFSHKDGSLAKAQLSYPTSRAGNLSFANREVIDIYAP